MIERSQWKKVRKAVFPVAGLGTRFLPATKVMPKEMLPLAGKPLIQRAVEEAVAAGIEEFIFVTGRYKEMLEEHFDYQPELMQTLEARGKDDMLEKIRGSEMEAGRLVVTRQPKPLGLGHAIWCARNLVGDEPFAVLLPDDVFLADTPCLAQMTEAYDRTGGNLCAIKTVLPEETARYGILDIESDNGKTVTVKGFVEKPSPEKAPSDLAVMGRYILQPEVFDHLAAFEKGAGGEIQITDAMRKLIGTQPFHGFHYDGIRYDCGTRLGFLEANIAFSLHDPEIGDAARDILNQFTKPAPKAQ